MDHIFHGNFNKINPEEMTGDYSEQAGLDAMQNKFSEMLKKRARAQADKKSAEDSLQERRESIAQSEAQEQEHRDKLLSKEERLAKLMQKRAEIQAQIKNIGKDDFV